MQEPLFSGHVCVCMFHRHREFFHVDWKKVCGVCLPFSQYYWQLQVLGEYHSVHTCVIQLFQRFQMRMNKPLLSLSNTFCICSWSRSKVEPFYTLNFRLSQTRTCFFLGRSSRVSQLLSSAYVEKECLACFPPKKEDKLQKLHTLKHFNCRCL